MALPDNLQPLPIIPADWPDDLPLDVQECRTALWLFHGNITKAAERLGTTSLRLRTFVRKSEFLSREIDEARQQLVDQAEHVISDALFGEPARADPMARWVAGSQGKTRGWGQGAPSVGNANMSVNVLVQYPGGADNPMNVVTISAKAEGPTNE
jgi:hypothetical protein